jgi:hypothetical protein
MAFMRVVNAWVRLLGWSPVGKKVFLRIDDAFEEALKGRNFSGRLTALNQDGTAVIELEMPLVLKDETIKCVIAVPRHQGYDFYYLYWGLIAVDLAKPNRMNVSTDEQAGTRIAIASLKHGVGPQG